MNSESGHSVNGDDHSLEDLIVRFDDLGSRRSSFRPRDMLLPRFERERYSVVGRPAEGTSADKRTGQVDAFSVVYVRCEPGKGIAPHAHDSSEVFIVLTGQWEVSCGDASTRLGPFDVISAPPDAMHGVVNVGDGPGILMAINEGKSGVPIRLAPEILAELAASGHEVTDPEYPPGAGPGSGR
jgi:quercetin dioxygenase-like cupin family protein